MYTPKPYYVHLVRAPLASFEISLGEGKYLHKGLYTVRDRAEHLTEGLMEDVGRSSLPLESARAADYGDGSGVLSCLLSYSTIR